MMFSIISVKKIMVKCISSISFVSGYSDVKLKFVIVMVISVKMFIGVQCIIIWVILNMVLEME